MALCECGCEQPTNLAPESRPDRGWCRGEPLRFLRGHNRKGRLKRIPDPVLEDRGHDTPCLIWQGAKTSRGYGQTREQLYAHRVAYEHAYGSTGLDLHHECEERDCVNPDHLRAMTRGDHARHHAALRRECLKEAACTTS